MDMGIISNLKLNHRNYLSKDENHHLENNLNFTVNVLDAMINLKKSWDDIKPLTIQNCFKKAEFKRVSDYTSVIQAVDIIAIENFQDQLPSFDDDLLPICGDEIEPSDENLDNDDTVSDDDGKDIFREITCATAMSHLQELSKSLLIYKCDSMDVHDLKLKVYNAIDNSKKQTKISWLIKLD